MTGRLAVVALVAALALTPGVPAAASPELEASEPPGDGVVEVAPDDVVLVFDAPVRPGSVQVQVVGDDGRVRHAAVGGGAPSPSVRVPLGSPLDEGRTLVGWQATGADDTEGSGAFVVVVDPEGRNRAEVSRVAAEGSAATTRRLGITAVALLGVAAALLAVEAGTGRRTRRPLLAVAGGAAALAAVLAAGWSGVPADGGWADLARADTWREATGGTAGRWLLLGAILVFVLPAVLQQDPGRRGRALRVGLAVPLAAVGLVALLALPSPSGAGSRSSTVALGADRIEVVVEPARRGVNEVHVYRTAVDRGAPEGALGHRLRVTHRPTGIGPLTVPLERVTDDHVLAPTVDLPLAGTWIAEVDLGGPDAPTTAVLDLEVR